MKNSQVYVLAAGIAVAILGTVTLLALNTDDTQQPAAAKTTRAAAPSPSASPSEDPATEARAAYLAEVHLIPTVSGTDEELLAGGQNICQNFDDQLPVKDIVNVHITGPSDTDRLLLVDAAVRNLCSNPAHAAAFAAYKKALPPTIAEGTWTVGQDNIPAGTYRTVEVAGGDCYWGIYKSGTNESEIVDNHIGGGRLTVTLRPGQDFSTQRCGEWVKIR